MIVEWGILANMVAVVAPLIVVLVTYIRTWSKFDGLIKNLTENVCVLQKTVEMLQIAQQELAQRVTKVEVQLDGMLEKIYLLHKVEKPCLGS